MDHHNERIPFRLIQMPCCDILICHVNHRLPNYCSECGARVFAAIKTEPFCIKLYDPDATLKYKST